MSNGNIAQGSRLEGSGGGPVALSSEGAPAEGATSEESGADGDVEMTNVDTGKRQFLIYESFLQHICRC